MLAQRADHRAWKDTRCRVGCWRRLRLTRKTAVLSDAANVRFEPQGDKEKTLTILVSEQRQGVTNTWSKLPVGRCKFGPFALQGGLCLSHSRGKGMRRSVHTPGLPVFLVGEGFPGGPREAAGRSFVPRECNVESGPRRNSQMLFAELCGDSISGRMGSNPRGG